MPVTAQTGVILLSILLAAGFVWGLHANRRLVRQLYRQMEDALRAWGTIARVRWLGGATSGLHVQVENCPAPWRRMEVILLLEPREFLPIWLWARWVRGQRDALLLRVVLRRNPSTEWEWRVRTWQPLRGFPPPRAQEGFAACSLAGFQGWCRPQVDAEALQHWSPLLTRYARHLRALSLRRQKPHLILEARVHGLDVAAFLRDVHQALEPWLR